ncbi:hypothetical protein DFH07DRAFT_125643 [Mycena maculata]|uniref:DUF6534 domain-containing protein n=1 Tax=Mycena maculata TaxID=230809 RepID=A0AAD7JY33_9AGAR|nr:hypothetical protein DFH07DRAFT_125643 [Mycena maculata]
MASNVVSLVKQGFATSFIGFAVATALYGTSVLQVYLYYRRYPTDRRTWKCVVALLFLLDTLSTAFVAHSLYTFFVLNFGKDPVEDLVIPWSFSTEKLLVTLITFVAQIFYAHATWKVTVNKTITFCIGLLAVVCLALGIVTTVDIFTIPFTIGTRRFLIISGCVQGFAALNDVLIVAGMCYHLQRNRSGLPSTNQFVDTLILYTVSRGILTAATQILFLITNVAFPGNTYYQPFHQAVGKLYVNSVLATLNVRHTFQQKSDVQYGTGPGFAFVHEGTGQSLSVGPQHSNISLDVSNTNSPDHENRQRKMTPECNLGPR